MISDSQKEYLAQFRCVRTIKDPEHADSASQPVANDYPKDSTLAKAYEVALDIRKFEIELYWKRSNSFWLVIAALGAILLGTLSAKDLGANIKSLAIVGICAFASVVAYAWSLVNIAGKFWQRNWEYQVGLLEDGVVGPLYKTVFSKESPTQFRLYSVSKLNLALSRCVVAAFALGALSSMPMPDLSGVDVTRLIWTKFALIIVALVGAVYIRSEGLAESAKNGINELRLHYTKREVGTLLQHKSEI